MGVSGKQLKDTVCTAITTLHIVAGSLNMPTVWGENSFLSCVRILSFYKSRVLALPAGAGKTTLMDVLACRKTAGRMEGQVMVGSAVT
jgi:hypothetical protein